MYFLQYPAPGQSFMIKFVNWCLVNSQKMKKYANYMILPEFRLILECCKGPATVEDSINMKKSEVSDELYNPDYNIIVDFRDFITSLDSTVNESTAIFFNFLKELRINSKVAFLTAEPHQVVISVILKEFNASLGTLKIEVFSTVEAALRYLGLPAEKSDLIDRKISELNYNTSL
jgi:hypothetical protein